MDTMNHRIESYTGLGMEHSEELQVNNNFLCLMSFSSKKLNLECVDY